MYYKVTVELPVISVLFKERMNKLSDISSRLSINDVQDDDDFSRVIENAKREVLLRPVTMSEPKIIADRQEKRQLPPGVHNMWGGPTQIHIITVGFPFDGSSELFSYMPEGIAVGGSEMRVYQPSGDMVLVDVELAKLEKFAAIGEAKSKMSTTKSAVKGNSDQAGEWNKKTVLTIVRTLEARRKELIDLYG